MRLGVGVGGEQREEARETRVRAHAVKPVLRAGGGALAAHTSIVYCTSIYDKKSTAR